MNVVSGTDASRRRSQPLQISATEGLSGRNLRLAAIHSVYVRSGKTQLLANSGGERDVHVGSRCDPRDFSGLSKIPADAQEFRQVSGAALDYVAIDLVQESIVVGVSREQCRPITLLSCDPNRHFSGAVLG